MKYGNMKSSPLWFENIVNDKLEAVQKDIARNAGRYDLRETDSKQVFQGFAGIHYAAYFGLGDMLSILLEKEHAVLTKASVSLQAPGIAPGAKFRLAGNSTVLAVAVLRGHTHIIQKILQLVETNESAREKILGVQNQSNFTNLLFSITARFDGAQLVYSHPAVLLNELFVDDESEFLPTIIAAYFGRYQFIEILQKVANNPKYQKQAFELVLKLDSQQFSVLDNALNQNYLEKLNCSLEDKQKSYDILLKLCKQAISFLKDYPEDEDLISMFLKGRSIDNIFTGMQNQQNEITEMMDFGQYEES